LIEMGSAGPGHGAGCDHSRCQHAGETTFRTTQPAVRLAQVGDRLVVAGYGVPEGTTTADELADRIARTDDELADHAPILGR
jgi:hypothetical protein